MKNTLSYKGYMARIEFDPDDNIFFGRVLGVKDIIGFHGETVAELTADFHNAINHYLDVCQQRGLNGQQGVLIPASNVPHLMLRQDVVDAAREGNFHIYPVSTIDEAITLLTGIDAGVIDEEGEFPEDSINGRVNERLEELAHLRHDFGKSSDDEHEQSDKDEKKEKQ